MNDGITGERLLQQVQASADAAGEIDWDISVNFSIVRAHQHAAGARTGPPPAPASKGAGTQNTRAKHRDRACSPGWWKWCGARVHYDESCLPDVRLAPTLAHLVSR
ncbi:hypothetical protein [Streptomyces sp. NPDC054940]